MIQRRQRNQILRLQTEDGTWINSESDINHHLLSFFSSLFTSVGNRNLMEALSVVEPMVSDVMNRSLIQPVSDEEIKAAVFQLGAVKSPGPDGFPGFFYQTYWDVVGVKVCEAV
ncbi:unnamed protein product [Camellia sinensis]